MVFRASFRDTKIIRNKQKLHVIVDHMSFPKIHNIFTHCKCQKLARKKSAGLDVITLLDWAMPKAVQTFPKKCIETRISKGFGRRIGSLYHCQYTLLQIVHFSKAFDANIQKQQLRFYFIRFCTTKWILNFSLENMYALYANGKAIGALILKIVHFKVV